MSEQVLHYSEIQDEPEVDQVVDLDSLYSLSSSEFSAEDFLEKSLSKEIEMLENQISSCRMEITERQDLHEKQAQDLEEKISEYRASLTHPHKLKRISSGEDFDEQRADMAERIGLMEEKIKQEERDNWKDKQKLKEEIRQLEKEVRKLRKRKRFMKASVNQI